MCCPTGQIDGGPQASMNARSGFGRKKRAYTAYSFSGGDAWQTPDAAIEALAADGALEGPLSNDEQVKPRVERAWPVTAAVVRDPGNRCLAFCPA
jgi:hypothetical protein